MQKNLLRVVSVLFLLSIAVSCTEQEPSIGIELQDPSTLFDGVKDTFYLTAYTYCEDSLATTGYSDAVIGTYSDAQFGSVEADLYTLVSTGTATGIQFDENCIIDSVTIGLAISELFPQVAVGTTTTLHLKIDRLSEQVLPDTTYYAFDQLPTSENLYDDTVSLVVSDTMMVRLRLASSVCDFFTNKSYSTSEFEESFKGLKITLVPTVDVPMAVVNLAAAATKLTVHHRDVNPAVGDTIPRKFDLTIGHSLAHFSHYSHTYLGALATFNTNVKDSIAGLSSLYMIPLSGTYVKFSMQPQVDSFRVHHPQAVIHYAELKMPISVLSNDAHPKQIQTLSRQGSSDWPISDMIDMRTAKGYDGTDSVYGDCYRARVTQHLQKILISGDDPGTSLYLYGRRSLPQWLILNGTDMTATVNNPIRIEFIYSE